MTRQSDKGVQLFKVVGEKEMLKFMERLTKLGFTEVGLEEKSKFLFKNKNKVPKRVSFENILQAQYTFVSSTGYKVYVHSSLIGQDFADKGDAWIMILNEKGEKVFVRKFAKYLAFTLLEKLSAYTIFCKKIADGRYSKYDLMEVGLEKPGLIWKHVKSSKVIPFVASYYYSGLPQKDRQIIVTKERQYFKNLQKSKDKPEKRNRNTRSTWKKK